MRPVGFAAGSPVVRERVCRLTPCGTLALLVVFAGCGARTGLVEPDAGADAGVDASVDAGTDAGPQPLCIVAPADAGEVTASLEIPATLTVVDVTFLLDSTGSMQDEINTVRRRLRGRVIPGIRTAIPDAAFGVALFGEFPVEPYGPPDVEPYELRIQVTSDRARMEAALDGTPDWANYDDPEATIEGLFQVVTGAGYGDPSTPGFIPSSTGCPGGGLGGVCFRTSALPIVMIITDAPMHNGPPGVPPIAPYDFEPAPHGYEETVAAVRALGALIIGLGASDFGRPRPDAHLRALANDTGSVDIDGQPLFFDIGDSGGDIGDDIVRAVEVVASKVPLDVDAVAQDLPGDAVDASVVLRGMRAVSADPARNVDRIEGDTFYGVLPGTRLTFDVVVDASGLPPSSARRVFPARVVFRASGRSRLGVEQIVIVVPGDDGIGCP